MTPPRQRPGPHLSCRLQSRRPVCPGSALHPLYRGRRRGPDRGPQLPTAAWPASRGAEPETQVWLTTRSGGAERPQAAHPGSRPAWAPSDARAPQVALVKKTLPANANAGDKETGIQSLGQEDALEEEMATHSSALGGRIPRTEEPGRVWCTGSQSQTRLKQCRAHNRCGAAPFIFLNIF